MFALSHCRHRTIALSTIAFRFTNYSYCRNKIDDFINMYIERGYSYNEIKFLLSYRMGMPNCKVFLKVAPSRKNTMCACVPEGERRQCDNTMTTMRQYDGDSAIVRWRQYDMTIALSPVRTIALSYCRHRIIALSPSYYRTVALVLSNCRIVLSSSYCRIVAIVLSHCRHRTIALSPS